MEIVRNIFNDNEAIVRSFDRAQEFQNLILFGRLLHSKVLDTLKFIYIYIFFAVVNIQELQASLSP